MRKILFCVYGLGIGGVEKCLVNLVNSLDPEQFDITVAVMNPEYAFREALGRHVKILPFEDYFVNTTDTMPLLRKSSFSTKTFSKFIQYAVYRLAVKLNLAPWKVQRTLPGQYDIAIAYTHVGHVPNYVIDRICAKRKILWYHTLWYDSAYLKTYACFDQIVTVSKHCKEVFLEHFPELADRTTVMYNLYDFDGIVQLAQEVPIDIDSKHPVIVSVGRLSPEKGIELALKACCRLKQYIPSGFKWYWIGDGPSRETANKMIHELEIEDTFVLLGNRTNPYPYMKYCDIYVQPSLREAYCTTIIEAKVLHKAIVATDIGSVHEQISHGYDGFIVSKEPDCLANQISELLSNETMRKTVEQNNVVPMNNSVHIQHYNKFFS